LRLKIRGKKSTFTELIMNMHLKSHADYVYFTKSEV
jgi:hypothetical protein